MPELNEINVDAYHHMAVARSAFGGVELCYVLPVLRITSCVPKIIINDTNNFFLNCNQHFRNFKL